MDLSDSQDAKLETTLSALNGKAEDKDSITAVPSKRAKFLQTYRRQQLFTLPDSIMHYIAKNPSSSKIYAKLIQSCKYFFIKNAILLIPKLSYHDHYGWKTVENGEGKNIDLDNITSKVWLNDEFKILTNDIQQNLASLLLSKIIKCDVTRLTLRNQIISYNELMILASKVEHVSFHQIIIKYQDGSILQFEKIFEAFASAKYFYFLAPSNVTTITTKTFAELLNIPHFSTIDHCHLENVPQDFDLENFYIYMKKNKFTQFLLSFSDAISAAYKSRLEEIIDEIIGTVNHDYKPPVIHFSVLNSTKLLKMYLL